MGYYELNDIIHLFNETPFFAEPGGILIVEKGINDYSFSEISQIVESNDAKLLGAFVSKMDGDLVRITLKLVMQVLMKLYKRLDVIVIILFLVMKKTLILKA